MDYTEQVRTAAVHQLLGALTNDGLVYPGGPVSVEQTGLAEVVMRHTLVDPDLTRAEYAVTVRVSVARIPLS